MANVPPSRGIARSPARPPARSGVLAALTLLLAALLLPPPVAADRWYDPPPMLGAVDAGRNLAAAHRAGAGWDRVVFLWQEIQPNGPDDWRLDQYIERAGLRDSLNSGLPIYAVVHGTPQWAAGNRADGAAAVPLGLEYPVEDPRNTFGHFLLRLARALDGRVSGWIIWNEPDFRPGDAGPWWNWVGNEEDLFKVVRAGYRAVKAVDPDATVVFPATAFYPDAANGRELFLVRVLEQAAKDEGARENGFYFDAVALNLYCTPADIYRVAGLYRDILARHGLVKPLWLTETNCPAYNDASHPMSPDWRVSTQEQAAYLLHAVAMARAAGYQRVGWYSLVDHDPNSIPDRYGLVRPDGSPRPAFAAFQVASDYLDHHGPGYFLPQDVVGGGAQWRVWRVVLDDVNRQRRVHVVWSGTGGPRTVRVPARGARAALVDRLGRETRLDATSGWWVVDLPPPRVPQPGDPPGFPNLGEPILVVEQGVPVGTPIGPLRQSAAPAVDRYFAQTGYTVEDERVWSYFWRLGGPESLGMPISYDFRFQGGTLQLFERAAIFVAPNGGARLLDLGGPNYLPLQKLIPGVEFPAPAYPSGLDTSRRDAVSGVQQLSRFMSQEIATRYFQTRLCSAAPRPACALAEAPERALERYGFPLSPPLIGKLDPSRQFQRFEYGVLWSNGAQAGDLPLGQMFKALLLGEGFSPDRFQALRDSRLFDQYAPGRPNFVRDPNVLPDTNLLDAF